jgi:hypothetical protein
MQNHGAKAKARSGFRLYKSEERIAPSAIASTLAVATVSINNQGDVQSRNYGASTAIVTDAYGNIVSYSSQQWGG